MIFGRFGGWGAYFYGRFTFRGLTFIGANYWEVALGRKLATFIFAKIKSSYGFCFGIEVVKNSEGACVFCIAVIGGAPV